MTKPCGMSPGGSPGLTREQVSIRYKAGRAGDRGGDEVHKSILASTLPAASPAVLLPVNEGKGGGSEGKV